MVQDTPQGQRADERGRGATYNPMSPYARQEYAAEHWEALDALPEPRVQTEYRTETPKTIVNKVDSPDVGMMYSLNPYQGCEHGCIYCYARPTHEYWGYSAGLDFESRIIVKHNAPELLSTWFRRPQWQPTPIALSGNTDCYQPAERQFRLTRRLLELFLAHRNPVSIITKNALVLRDLDLLRPLAQLNLVHVTVSITSLDEGLRHAMEPRTVPYKTRLKVLQALHTAGVPTRVMMGPIIPGLTVHEIPRVLQAAAEAGAQGVVYTLLRLNGPLGPMFEHWVRHHYPDRADRVLHQVQECHGGKLNDTRWGKRMRGDGPVADMVARLVKLATDKHYAGRSLPPYDLSQFRRQPERATLF